MRKNNSFIPFKSTYPIYVLGSLIVLSATCLMVHIHFLPLLRTEQKITEFFQQLIGTPAMNYKHGLLNDVMTFFATYGDATPLVILTVLFSLVLFLKKYNFLAFWFLGVVATGGVVGTLMKFAFHRSRPMGHLPIDDGFSFPSGHAVGSTLFFSVICLVFLPKIQQTAARNLLMVLTVAIWIGILASRIYFSAHHLADLLGGVAFGLFWVLSAMCMYALSASWFQKYVFKKSRL